MTQHFCSSILGAWRYRVSAKLTPRIMAGMVQKDSCSGMARLVFLVTVHLVLCFFPSLQARDARHHGRYGPEGFFGMCKAWFAGI